MYLYLNIKTASKDWQNLQRPYQQGRDLLFIRMLLQKRKGIGSFSELRTVGDIEYVTAEKACEAMNLIQNDSEIFAFLEECSTYQMPSEIRDSFYRVLIVRRPINPLAVFESFKQDMSDDFRETYIADEIDNSSSGVDNVG